MSLFDQTYLTPVRFAHGTSLQLDFASPTERVIAVGNGFYCPVRVCHSEVAEGVEPLPYELDVESNFYDIAIFDNVILAFNPQPTMVAGFGGGPIGHKVIK